MGGVVVCCRAGAVLLVSWARWFLLVVGAGGLWELCWLRGCSDGWVGAYPAREENRWWWVVLFASSSLVGWWLSGVAVAR